MKTSDEKTTPQPLTVWKFSALTSDPRLILIELPPEANTLDRTSSFLPGGAYTTLRTYRYSKALHLSDHIQRLGETASLAGHPLPIVEEGLRSAIRRAMDAYRSLHPQILNQDLRVRLIIDLDTHPGDAFIAVESLTMPPPTAYTEGVAAVTCQMERSLPEAKLTRFIQRSQPVRNILPAGVNEALMVNTDGAITEGLSSNFFGVLRGQIRTAGVQVLKGVTRAIVLSCIQRHAIPLLLTPIQLDETSALDECFITSASRGVLPVCLIDDHPVGSGAPGPITRKLIQAFEAAVLDQLEEI